MAKEEQKYWITEEGLESLKQAPHRRFKLVTRMDTTESDEPYEDEVDGISLDYFSDEEIQAVATVADARRYPERSLVGSRTAKVLITGFSQNGNRDTRSFIFALRGSEYEIKVEEHATDTSNPKNIRRSDFHILDS